MTKQHAETGIKAENKQAVFRYLLRHGPSTKQELFSQLGLSLPTIKQVLEYLEQAHLISASGTVRNTGGRNAQAYSVLPNGRYAAGLYLSQNRIEAVCVDLCGAVIAKKTLDIPLNVQARSYMEAVGRVLLEAKTSSKLSDRRFLGAGIAIPSIVSADGERAVFGMTSDFTGLTRSAFQEFIPDLIRLYHDSAAAGMAEVWKSPDHPNAIYLNLNDSIGSAIIIDGALYQGSNRLAGELGHVIVAHENGKKCYCGQHGCFDTVCNAGVLHAYTDGDLAAFFHLLDAGDETAASMWNDYLDHLAYTIHNLRVLFDCSFIIGGQVGEFLAPHLVTLCQKVDDLSVFTQYSREYIALSRYGSDATAAGAAIGILDSFIDTI